MSSVEISTEADNATVIEFQAGMTPLFKVCTLHQLRLSACCVLVTPNRSNRMQMDATAKIDLLEGNMVVDAGGLDIGSDGGIVSESGMTILAGGLKVDSGGLTVKVVCTVSFRARKRQFRNLSGFAHRPAD